MAKKVKVTELEEAKEEGKKLYATADFDIPSLDLYVKAGDEFVLPAGWKQDKQQEEFLNASKVKQGKSVGIVFSYLGAVVNPGEKNLELRERRTHTTVLPLEVR